MKTIATLFPRALPVSFDKGVGRIAYHFARDLGWRSVLAYCELSDAPPPAWYADRVEVHRLGTVDLSDRLTQFRRQAVFLARNARRIDLLNLYDLRPETYALAAIYQRLNPRGTAFLKLDMDERAVEQLIRPSLRTRAHLALLRHSRIAFCTVETRPILKRVSDIFDDIEKPVHLVPIGFDVDRPLAIDDTLKRKEKIILSVGRLGSRQKHNELLLEALISIDPHLLDGWKIIWAGGDEGGFRSRAHDVLRKHPRLADRVEFAGHISDRAALYDLYRRASVFALSSRWESFGTVLTEALYFGCVPIATRVGGASDLTDEGRFGELVEPENLAAYRGALSRVLKLGAAERARIGRRVHDRVRDVFGWRRVCAALEAAALHKSETSLGVSAEIRPLPLDTRAVAADAGSAQAAGDKRQRRR